MRLLHRPSYRTTWVNRYKNVSILNFIGAKNDGCTVSSTTARPGLRSAVSTDYVVPRLRMKFGERAFSYAGPVAWNSLPSLPLTRRDGLSSFLKDFLIDF